MFGLRQTDIDFIVEVLKNTPQVERAYFFGSRALGNYKPGSDVDIAIEGEYIDFNVLARIHYILEEQSPMPYFFDVVDYTHLNNPELIDHIKRVNQVFYTR